VGIQTSGSLLGRLFAEADLMVYGDLVRPLILVMLLSACHVPDTKRPPDASTEVEFQLALSTRYLDPGAALDGLSVWVNEDNHIVGASNPVIDETYESIEVAQGVAHRIAIRFGSTQLDEVIQRPGDLCASNQGSDNRLLSESVTICLRSNGEVSLNDFTCQYEKSGFFTADVYCPTDCSPISGRQTCGEERCALVLTHAEPRFGVMACVPKGVLGAGEWCRAPVVGAADSCDEGLACVDQICRTFCATESDCLPGYRCVSALANDAEPFVCVDPAAARSTPEAHR
jgi:hypothetical protein